MSSSASTAAGRRRSTARPTGPRPAARGAQPRAKPQGPKARPKPRRPRPQRPQRRPGPRPGRASATTGVASRLRPRSWRAWALVGLALAAAGVGGYFGWFRDSSLVAVTEVRVEGATGADSERITAALRDTAAGMTTLHFDPEELEAAVSSFPTVASIEVEASFPNSMTITVSEREPALVAIADERAVPVAADGSLLPTLPVDEAREAGLPELRLDELGDEKRLQGTAREQALVVGATPEPMRPLIGSTGYDPAHGVEVVLEGGIELRFGSGSDAEAKWSAATSVLADPALTRLLYVDVREPSRPAVGGVG